VNGARSPAIATEELAAAVRDASSAPRSPSWHAVRRALREARPLRRGPWRLGKRWPRRPPGEAADDRRGPRSRRGRGRRPDRKVFRGWCATAAEIDDDSPDEDLPSCAKRGQELRDLARAVRLAVPETTWVKPTSRDPRTPGSAKGAPRTAACRRRRARGRGGRGRQTRGPARPRRRPRHIGAPRPTSATRVRTSRAPSRPIVTEDNARSYAKRSQAQGGREVRDTYRSRAAGRQDVGRGQPSRRGRWDGRRRSSGTSTRGAATSCSAFRAKVKGGVEQARPRPPCDPLSVVKGPARGARHACPPILLPGIRHRAPTRPEAAQGRIRRVSTRFAEHTTWRSSMTAVDLDSCRERVPGGDLLSCRRAVDVSVSKLSSCRRSSPTARAGAGRHASVDGSTAAGACKTRAGGLDPGGIPPRRARGDSPSPAPSS